MNWPLLAGVAIMIAALAALLHWQLNLAEGVYLGRRVVVWLYDRFAPRYDAVKQFNQRDEDWFLGKPLAQVLQNVTSSQVLDVATGTARLPMALLRQPTFTGRVIGLDLSRKMLRQAAINTAKHKDRVTFIWQDATCLPFTDASFDAVTCLEALEFLPDMSAALAEMVRVLRPGGIFFITNRIGPGMRWMPGRTMSSQELAGFLESLSLTDVRAAVWQVDYDLVWGRRPSTRRAADPAQCVGHAPTTLPALLRCPQCASTPLSRNSNGVCCDECGSRFPIADDGVIEMGF
jgi:ubiquinone/menaquinone biosynthesis C-methylase UbiE